jgi:predicted amidohydrolase
MPKPILLRGGRIVDPSTQTDVQGDLLLADGRVEALAPGLDAPDGHQSLHRPAGDHEVAQLPAVAVEVHVRDRAVTPVAREYFITEQLA